MGDSLDTVGSSGGGGGQTVASDAMPEELAELSINDMEQDGTSDPADSSAECALAEPSAKVCGRPKAAAQAAVAALSNMSLSWEDDSPNWRFLLVAARHAKDKVERALAGTDSFEDVSGSELVPNADAWEGPRRKDFVEIATDKRKHRQRLAATAAVRAAARAANKGSGDSDEGGVSSMSGVPIFCRSEQRRRSSRAAELTSGPLPRVDCNTVAAQSQHRAWAVTMDPSHCQPLEAQLHPKCS
ncbi:g3375 [Coccomyxa elongata]